MVSCVRCVDRVVAVSEIVGGATRSGWLLVDGGTPSLVCFPHAGGGTAPYRRVASEVTDRYGVVLTPGRPPQPGGTTFTDLRQAAECVAAAVALAGPGSSEAAVTFWGHSMGALLAFETALVLQEIGWTPRALVLTGRDAPGGPAEERHLWSDADLVEHLRAVGGTPEAVLAELVDPATRDLIVGWLRHDLALLASHQDGGGGIDCPVVVLGGRDDPSTTAAGLAAWRLRATGSVQVDRVPGGHFFPWEGAEVVDVLRDAVDTAPDL